MATQRAPKQWCLTRSETVNSFENWRQNLQYTLSLDANFAPYLVDGCSWLKRTKTCADRGFTDDEAAGGRTAAQKVTHLELMLGQVANYCPVISRNTIVKNSTSIGSIWQAIRTHYGFQSSGAHFLDFAEIKLEPHEKPEDLYQRLMAFVEDNLLLSDGGITHHGDAVTEDEDMSPSLENMIILTWLRLLHPSLPKLVKQRYGTELRSRTLASIKPEISQALGSLMDEVRDAEEAKVMRSAGPTLPTFSRTQSRPPPRQSSRLSRPTNNRVCPLCKQAGRRDFNHFLSTCSFLPEQDKKFITKARLVAALQDELDPPALEEPLLDNLLLDDDEDLPSASSTRRVQVKRSPFMHVFHDAHPLSVTIDSGAEVNMIRESVAHFIGAPISRSSQVALQADGKSPLVVKGETKITLVRHDHTFVLEALVVENMDVDILAGVPFMSLNDVSVRPAKQQVIFSDGSVFYYGNAKSKSGPDVVRRTQAFVLRSPSRLTTVWPGEFVELDAPPELALSDYELALEPRTDSRINANTSASHAWPPPCITTSVAGKIRIANTSDAPVSLHKGDHVCQVRPVRTVESLTSATDQASKSSPSCSTRPTCTPPALDSIKLDQDNILPDSLRSDFRTLHEQFASVFSGTYGGYNGACGPFEAVVNMGPVLPPQRKGRVPQYARDRLVDLQQKFDSLEEMGVFRRPEDVGVVAEYLNPSFLVKKPTGGFRLVTAFAEVGKYSKPQPSLMPDVDSTLRTIAKWRYIIATDLTSAFYQIPLSKDSMRFCGVVTPFKGVRVYTRCAMGMPGSETALEELMCRVLGDLLQEGIVAKLADDLYCGGDSPAELLSNWHLVLEALERSGLCLSPSKTVVCPKSTTILGWVWSEGRIMASPHRIATLASCPPPTNVRAMRSFIGAYKVLSRVIPGCSGLLTRLDDSVAGRQSSDTLVWTDDLRHAFQVAQTGLKSAKTITLPRPSDQLWVVTDGAVKDHGLGATLYVTRDGKLHLAGFFSAKLRKRQMTWIPCEIEALCIASAVKHFSPFIIQSANTAVILTDSKPCVQAYDRLCRGEFSASVRVSTFLATASRFQVSVQHLAGSANLPSDFASRNAPSCDNSSCQICNFIAVTETSVVRSISVQDVLDGSAKLPFTTRSTWLPIQDECPDLRRTRAHLKQGTRPSKKATNVKDVKRYLSVATTSKDGLIVVPRSEPLVASRELIVVPRQVLDGLLTALHIKLVHPSPHQLKMVVSRFFYALDMDKAIERISQGCHHCASLRKIPPTVVSQSCSDPPESIGVSFAGDVLKRERQLIFVLRECVTSFTSACFVDSETKLALRDAIIQLCVPLRPLDGPLAVIRTDAATALCPLIDDVTLRSHRIQIEVGRVKNENKNPVAERAIQELEREFLLDDPTGGPVSQLQLALAVARLNSRIRSRGLSARELLTQRDQFTCAQLPVQDLDVIRDQHTDRIKNHPYSEKSKSPHMSLPSTPSVSVGSIVYLISDGDKSRGRPRYLVTSVDGPWCNIRKFTGSQLRNNSYRVKLTDCYMVVPSLPVDVGPLPCATDDSDPPLDRDEEYVMAIPASVPTQVVPPSALTTPLATSAAEPQSNPVRIDQHLIPAAVGSPTAHHDDARVSAPSPCLSPPPDGPGGVQPECQSDEDHLPTCLNETPPSATRQPPPTPTANATSRSGRPVRPPGWLVKDYELKF